MKTSEQERLLREILANEKVEQLRSTSLETMLGSARRHHRRRGLVAASAATLAGAMLVLVATHRALTKPDDFPTSPSKPAAMSGVKVITDEQLLALFADRSAALIGPPGEQRLWYPDAAGTVKISARTME